MACSKFDRRERMPAERWLHHLESCPHCRRQREMDRRLQAELGGLEKPALPLDFSSRLLARAARERREELLDAGWKRRVLQLYWLGALLAGCWIFVSLPWPDRLGVPLLAAGFGTLLLLLVPPLLLRGMTGISLIDLWFRTLGEEG